jgi:hypothetical protein
MVDVSVLMFSFEETQIILPKNAGMETPENTLEPVAMEEKTAMVELLIERATDYGKTSYQLIRLKVLAQTADFVSTLLPRLLVGLLFASFLLFGSLGLADWLGEVLGKPCYGSFVVAGIYALLALLTSIFLHRRIKRVISNFIIFKILK